MLPFLLPALIAGGSTLLSGLFQGGAQRRAAREQAAALREQMSPYAAAGTNALGQMQTLMGMGSPEDQAAMLASIEQGPEMQAMMAQGENAILQNAAATGGLRGGNTQGTLAQFRPQVLNQLISQRMSQLGGLASMGYNAASTLGKGLGDAAAARALGAGTMWNALPNALSAGMGMYTGLGGGFGGAGSAAAPMAAPVSPTYNPAYIGGRNAMFAEGGGW